MSFARELDIALRARCTLILVVTREEMRAIESIRTASQRPVILWDAADGFQPPTEKPIRDAMAALDHIEQKSDDAVVVLRDFHDFWGNAVVKRKLRNVTQRLRQARRSIIVLSPTAKLPEELRDEAVIIDFGLPGQDELRHVLDVFCNTSGLKITLTALGREKLVAAAAGLSAMQMRRQLSRAIIEHGVLDDRHITLMAEAKKQILRDHEALEFFPVTETPDDVGGLDVLKDWLRSRERAFTQEARDYGVPAPKGIALLGIPGTGKSLTARIVGALWRMPLIRLDVGSLFGSLVGESEERVRRALRVAEAVAPCILWIDELEKALAGGAVDGGTSARVFGTILTWMQEKTSPCFVVATANQVDALPPELLRRGRFDEIFFLDLPTLRERREIFAVHIRKRQRLPQDYDLDALARKSEGFVGAEIEQAVLDAMYTGFNAKREFTTQDISDALTRLIPMSQSQRETVQKLRSWLAEGRAQSATFQEAQEASRRFVPIDFDDLIKGN